MSLAPVMYLARRLIRRTRMPEELACEVVTVCPKESAVRPKAYFQPEQLDRVRFVVAKGGMKQQLERISETSATHAATKAYLYNDATLLDGSLFVGKARMQLTMERPPRLLGSVKTTVSEAALVGTTISNMYFGHYVVDDSATILLAQDFGTVRSLESSHRADWNHAAAYRDLMDLTVPDIRNARLRRAWVFQDYGMNSHRRRRIQDVRRRLAKRSADHAGRSIFLLRSRSGRDLRILENELEVADTLSRHGFVVVDPTQHTADDIIRKVSGATLVVSVEGSALAHAYLTMREDGAIVTIQPPYRFETIWKDFTDLLGMRYGFVVAEGSRDSFRVDVDDLLRTIDLVTV